MILQSHGLRSVSSSYPLKLQFSDALEGSCFNHDIYDQTWGASREKIRHDSHLCLRLTFTIDTP